MHSTRDEPDASTALAEVIQAPGAALAAAQATSCVAATLVQLASREAAEAALAGRAGNTTARTYLHAWTDFGMWLEQRRGEEPAARWRNAQRRLTPIEARAYLGLLDERIGGITVADVEAYRMDMLARPTSYRGTAKVGLEQATIITRLAAIRRLCLTAIRLGLRADDPTAGIYRGRPPSRYRQRALTPEDERRLVEHCHRAAPLRDRCLVLLLLYMGLRRDEASRLVRSSVRPSDDGGLVLVGVRRKGDVYQDLIVPRILEPVLREHLAALPEDDGPIFRSPKGQALTGQRVEAICKQHTKLALGEPRAPHTLRRTFATRVLNLGVPLQEVQAYMGHADPATTIRYRDLTPSRDRCPMDVALRGREGGGDGQQD